MLSCGSLFLAEVHAPNKKTALLCASLFMNVRELTSKFDASNLYKFLQCVSEV